MSFSSYMYLKFDYLDFLSAGLMCIGLILFTLADSQVTLFMLLKSQSTKNYQGYCEYLLKRVF